MNSSMLNHAPNEYHYTLYYYDQAGNLVKTIPPVGVRPDYDSTYLANVRIYRSSGSDLTPPNNNDSISTKYRYKLT